MQNKAPTNEYGQEHGFWEIYTNNIKEFSVHFVDGEPMGYLEYNNPYHPLQNNREYYAR